MISETILTFATPRDRDRFLEDLIREECRRDIARQKGLEKILKKVKEVMPDGKNTSQ